MSIQRFSLSVEEMILSLSVMGRQETAAGLLGMTIGPLSDEELEVRMLTAGHSLAAREWLQVLENGQTHTLDPDLQEAIRPIADAEHSIRLSKWENGQELTLGLHVAQGTLTTHEIRQGVIHRVQRLENLDDVVETVESFLSIQYEAAESQEPLLWNRFADSVAERENGLDLHPTLLDSGLPEEISDMIARDLQQTEGFWSILRIEYTEDNRDPYSTGGILLLPGSAHTWMISEVEGSHGEQAKLRPCSRDELKRELQNLL
ncbi:hypothetical protein JJB07_16535 [Tumebacillus sp. ITR2]|uniref:Uncharacterized protein n=1 Tax=Tumebacillus amylolyticus TaxID=2801339 RepID=A0ABS1JD62_9BACL|nr:hypothetical protein [Tumebacillus amylolyticus]MBL0388222.1 hypothetical protein [Tumebacillus amylolyticus]